MRVDLYSLLQESSFKETLREPCVSFHLARTLHEACPVMSAENLYYVRKERKTMDNVFLLDVGEFFKPRACTEACAET